MICKTLYFAPSCSHFSFFQLFAFALKLGKQTYILDLLTSVNLEHVGNRENVEENHISVKQQFYKSQVEYHFWEKIALCKGIVIKKWNMHVVKKIWSACKYWLVRSRLENQTKLNWRSMIWILNKRELRQTFNTHITQVKTQRTWQKCKFKLKKW